MDEGTKKEINLDSVLETLGPFGTYNLLNFSLLLLPIFLSSFYECGYIFEAQTQEYRCEIPECEHLINNSTIWKQYAMPKGDGGMESCERYAWNGSLADTDQCSADLFNSSQVLPCETYVFATEHSVVKDFGLACREWQRTLVGTIHNSGMFIAMLLTGSISDRFGRKVALGMAAFANFIFGVTRSFAPEYISYVALHFLEAALGGGLYSSAYVLAVELVGPKQRVMVTALCNFSFVLGMVTLAGLAWFVQNWRNYLRIVYIPAIIVAMYMWPMNESARWLLSKGRKEEAIKILSNAAKLNGLDAGSLGLNGLADPLLKQESQTNATKNKSQLYRAIRSTIIWKRVSICSFLWVTCSLVYYGMSINSVSLAGDRYVSFIFVVLAEIPAYLIVLVVLDKYGRKKTLMVTFITCGVMSLLFASFPKMGWASKLLYLIGKCSVTLAYSSVYIYVSEVFPTNMRQTLISVCSTCGRLGSLLAPLTPLLALYYKSLPSIIFGVMTLISSILVYLLPETNKTRLPDTIEEAEGLSRKTKKNIENISLS